MKLALSSRRLSGLAILDLFIEFIYLAVIFLIPLWFSYWFPTYNIFELNKTVIFRILVTLLLAATGLKLLFYPPSLNLAPAKFFKKYWLVPTIFILGLSLTLFSSINPVWSFYGTITRQAGLASYLFYFLWFILLSFNLLTVNNQLSLKSETAEVAEVAATHPTNLTSKIRRVIMVATLSGAIVALYAILQFLNIDWLVWPEPAFITQRAFSSFGQPNFLASWLLLVIPLGVYLFFTSRRFLSKFAWLLAVIFELAALFMTGSRGGLLALLGALALLLIYYLVISAWPRRRKYTAVLLFIGLTIVALWLLDYSSHGRVRQLADINDGSLGARVDIYESAASAIFARPIFGYGLETESEIFIKYYTPEWGIYGDVGQTADRAHNIILDILLSTGVWGLLLFGALYYFVFNLVRNNLQRRQSPALTLAVAFGLTAYLLSLLFSFSFVGSEVYFWSFLAILVILNLAGEFKLSPPPASTLRRSGGVNIFIKIIATLILGAVCFWQINLAARMLLADYYFNKIYLALGHPAFTNIFLLDDYLRAETPNPVNLASYDYALADQLNSLYPNLTDSATRRLVGDKLQALDRVLPAWGYENLTVKARINTNLHNFISAQADLTPVLTLTPYWPPVHIAQGELALAENNIKGALVSYYSALLNLPNTADPRLNSSHRSVVWYYQYFISNCLAAIYQQQKDYAAAAKYYKLAYQGDPSDTALLKKIADTYYLRGDLPTAIVYNQHGLERDPSDYHWPLALAILYRESGNKVQALNYINQARHLAPNNQELINLEREYTQSP